jgi:hypothetical protein
MQNVLLLELSSLECLRCRKDLLASFTLPSDWNIPIAAKQKFSFLMEVYFASFTVAKSMSFAFLMCSEFYYCFSVSSTINNSLSTAEAIWCRMAGEVGLLIIHSKERIRLCHHHHHRIPRFLLSRGCKCANPGVFCAAIGLAGGGGSDIRQRSITHIKFISSQK